MRDAVPPARAAAEHRKDGEEGNGEMMRHEACHEGGERRETHGTSVGQGRSTAGSSRSKLNASKMDKTCILGAPAVKFSTPQTTHPQPCNPKHPHQPHTTTNPAHEYAHS